MRENQETCTRCGEPTGKAGKGEDSLYRGDVGPFCDECFEKEPPVKESNVPTVPKTSGIKPIGTFEEQLSRALTLLTEAPFLEPVEVQEPPAIAVDPAAPKPKPKPRPEPKATRKQEMFSAGRQPATGLERERALSPKSLSAIDPELRRAPEPGRTLEDLKKALIPIPMEGSGMTEQEKRMKKAELAREYPGAKEEWTMEEVVRALMGSIIMFAQKYASSRYPIEDAVQQGILGVYNAVRMDKGEINGKVSPFAGYAWNPIQAAIARDAYESDVVRVPDSSAREGGIRVKTDFLGREIAGPEGEPTTADQVLPASAGEYGFTLPSERGASHHLRKGEERSSETSPRFMTPERRQKLEANKELLDKVLQYAKLTPEEHEIVTMMYGIDDGIEKGTNEIAGIIGKRNQRVSEIKAKALAKLTSAARMVRALSKHNVPEARELEQIGLLIESIISKIQ